MAMFDLILSNIHLTRLHTNVHVLYYLGGILYMCIQPIHYNITVLLYSASLSPIPTCRIGVLSQERDTQASRGLLKL